MLLNRTILRYKREYYKEEVKAPLMKAMVGFAKCGSWISMLIALIQIVRIVKRYPEPTRENTPGGNVHILLGIEDKFFKYENNSGRDALFRAAFRLFIATYAHDPYYRYRADWFKEEWDKSNWELRPAGHPNGSWKEPKPSLLKRILARPIRERL